jgi:predicted Zn-ribbon and HTH transcriptional regulator
MPKIMLEGYKCERCGHEWVPRSKVEESPTICPRCKSPYWDKPRINRVQNPRVKQPKVEAGKIKNVRT